MAHNPYGNRFVIDDFDMIPDTVKYAYITEWFDSVGIYISINRAPITSNWVYSIDKDNFCNKFKSRKQATKVAIEKANELYNYKFK